jgi:hypothetical protein
MSMTHHFQVGAIIPYFWNYSIVDPNYSLLLGIPSSLSNSKCSVQGKGDNNLNTNMVAGVVVGVGAAAAIVTGIAGYKKYSVLKTKRKTSMKLSEEQQQQLKYSSIYMKSDAEFVDGSSIYEGPQGIQV